MLFVVSPDALRAGLERVAWDRRCRWTPSTRLVPDPVLAFDDGEAGWRATLAGLGIARAPLFLAADALRGDGVVERLRPWRDADMPVPILRRETRLTPPRRERLIAFLKHQPPRLDGS